MTMTETQARRALTYLEGDDVIMENVKAAREILRSLIASDSCNVAASGRALDEEAIRAEARAEAVRDIGSRLAELSVEKKVYGKRRMVLEIEMSSLATILADEPKEREAEGPQIGDWVAVRFNGVLSRKSWTAMVWDEECANATDYFEEVRVIERKLKEAER